MPDPAVVLRIGSNDAEAQARIRDTIKALDAMGKSVNEQSGMAQRAFRAEAQEAKRLLDTLKATTVQQEELGRVVQRTESRISAAATSMGRQYGAASRSIAMGIDQIARTGNVAGEGLKQVIATGAEMAFMFGVGGPIVGAIGISGMALFNFFQRSRKEIEETRKKAETELAALQNAGNISGITDRARAIEFGLPSEGPSAHAAGAFKGSLRDLRAELEQLNLEIVSQQGEKSAKELANMTARANELRGEIKKLEKDIADLMSAAQNVGNAPAERGMAPVVVAARSTAAAIEQARRNRLDFKNLNLRDGAPSELSTMKGSPVPLKSPDLAAIGADAMAKAENPFASMTISAADASERLTLVSMALGGINSALGEMGKEAESQFGRLTTISDVANATIWNVAEQGMQSLIRGGESTAKVLKKAAAEPIIAKLKMKGIEYAKESAGAFAQLNIPQGVALAAAAAGAFIGANKVAQLAGGGGGGGGGEGAGSGGGGGVNQRADGTGLGAQLGSREQTVRVEIVVVQKGPDGQETQRIMQKIQRLRDLEQPIRVVL